MIDCHIHTINSDGLSTVGDILSHCSRMDYNLISITDHDTILGLKQVAIPVGCNFIYGTEITAICNGREVHILAYFKEMPKDDFELFLWSNKIKRAVLLNRYKRGNKVGTENNVEEISNKIHEYNGIAIIAHPMNYPELLNDIVEYCDGMELIYPSHDRAIIEYIIKQYSLRCRFFTVGSDFHSECYIGNSYITECYNRYKNLFASFVDYCIEDKRK